MRPTLTYLFISTYSFVEKEESAAMETKFQIQARIQKPIREVFDAVYNPQKIAGYFVTAGSSAPLDEGSTVMWEFADFPGPFPVNVTQMVPNKKIVFQWDATHPSEKGTPYKTTVEITFEELEPSNTLVSISESGWEDSENGYQDSRGNSQGWMNMLTCLKAYAEYGINLRKGMFS